MPIPPHVAELRVHIGHALLWLATARTVTIDDHGHGLPAPHDSDNLTQRLDITFRCRATGGQPKPRDGEFQNVRWHTVSAI
jgi:hypothetical protein